MMHTQTKTETRRVAEHGEAKTGQPIQARLQIDPQ